MRNPRKMRNSSIVVSILAIATIAFGAHFSGKEQKDTTAHTIWTLLTVAGVGVAFFSVPLIVIRQFQMLPQNQLARGERVRARYTVPPDQWSHFQQLSLTWDRDPQFGGANQIDVKQMAPPTGIEVVIGEYGLQVGGDFHSIGTMNGIQVHDGWLGVHRWLATDEVGGRTLHYRWPFPPEAKNAVTSFRNPSK